MFILVKPKPITAKSRVYLVKSYRDINGRSRHKIVKCYGSYKKLAENDPHFMSTLKQEALIYESKITIDKKIIVDPARPNRWHNIYNIGYIFCKAVLVAFRKKFLNAIQKLKLEKFYRYLFYRVLYDNQAEFQHELFYEGPFSKNFKFPNYKTFQYLSELLGNVSKNSVLIVQSLSIYQNDEPSDRLFYLLIDSSGYPIYFHLVKFPNTISDSSIKSVVTLLETKFKTKIYLVIHPSVLSHLSNNTLEYRSWNDYKKSYPMSVKLGVELSFTESQMKVLDHVIIGINKHISSKSIQLYNNSSNDQIQLTGFIIAFQIGVFNYFRILAFNELNIDFQLRDIQETFTQIDFNDFSKDYVHIVLNPRNEKWRQLYYLIFNKEDANKMLINPYFKVADLKQDVWIDYISKKYKEISKRRKN